MTFKDGDLARVKKTGQIVRLDSVNPNDTVPEDEIWADATGEYGSVQIESEDDVEPYTAPEIDAAKIAAEVSGSLHGGFGNVLSITETEVDGVSVEVQGAYNGMPVSFVVTISHVYSDVSL